MGDRLKGKAAVVTGAGGGLGREVALALAEAGASVIVNDIGAAREGSGSSTAPADEVVKEIETRGGHAAANYESVADFAGAERIIRGCVASFGKIDILVNMAGIIRERMIFNMSEEEWDTVMAVNAKGTWNCTRHACVQMKEQKSGRIINTPSDVWRGTVGQSNYSAAKGAIVSLTYSVAQEMGRYGVTCNAVIPRARTRMTMNERVIAGLERRLKEGLITRQYYDAAMSMPGPEYFPPLLVYLASDAAADISGQIFIAYGGTISVYSKPEEIRTVYKAEGIWAQDELDKAVTGGLAGGFSRIATG